jgi:hypothetical protein
VLRPRRLAASRGPAVSGLGAAAIGRAHPIYGSESKTTMVRQT